MCEIQLIKRFDNQYLTKNDIDNFICFMELGNQTNKDAYGVFNQDKTLLMSNGKFDRNFMETLKGDKHKFLVGHNRYKTKGDSKIMSNNHPFETDNFIMVHNGVIVNDDDIKSELGLNYNVETDSYIIIAQLEHYIKTLELEEALKQTFSNLAGSYSIVVYHKPSNRLFYTKNGSTHFTFGLIQTKTGDILIGSTDDENFDITLKEAVRGVFGKSTHSYISYEPKAYFIYEILPDKLSKGIEYDCSPLYKKKAIKEESGLYDYVKGYQKVQENSTTIATQDDFKKKQVFKHIAKIVTNCLTPSIKIETRSYYLDERNCIIFYLKDDIPMMDLELIQDKIYQYGSVCLDVTNDSKKWKLIIDVDYNDAIKYLQEEEAYSRATTFDDSFDSRFYEGY